MGITIISGNQSPGDGNAGNQLEAGSALIYQRVGVPTWITANEAFCSAADNNKYFAATALLAMALLDS